MSASQTARTVAGYRGIWFTLGQFSEHGDKYSGGLGTYTANHNPMAVHAPGANRTFFVYGGAPADGERYLLCMIGCYDHATGRVSRPVVVHDKDGVNDPHDNPSLAVDDSGHVWVFVSGRGRKRPGFKYRSIRPFEIDAFELVEEREMTYPQPHIMPDGGMLLLFTQYTAGRELYWQTSSDGRQWNDEHKLAGLGGHYQVSGRHGSVVGSTFMYHPDGDVDRRTNLYYVQTADAGRSWTTIAGKPLTLPLSTVENPALVIGYQKQGLNVYVHDLNFDDRGRPVILYLTSRTAFPGPGGGPWTWRVTQWTGDRWATRDVTTSDHCYDTGCIHTDGPTWHILGPTEPGPQTYATGGEVAVWASGDSGETWTQVRQITRDSARNHSYVRRPLNARDPFAAFWADGHAAELSDSRLYFCDREGRQTWQLPADMASDWEAPRPCLVADAKAGRPPRG